MRRPSPLQRFDAATQRSDGCWKWTGGKSGTGYGMIFVNGKRELAHRFSYEQFVGPIPAGLQIDHVCRNRWCVRPNHLRAVTCAVNVLCGVGPTAANARKTHCQNGHPFDVVIAGARRCRECFRANYNQWQRDRNRRQGPGVHRKLKDNVVAEIRAMAMSGMVQSRVAEAFNVSQSYVSLVVHGLRREAKAESP